MFCGQPNPSWLLASTNPHRSRATDQSEGIVSDQCRGTFERKADWVVCIGSNRAKLIGNTQHNSSCIASVGRECFVVWQQMELPIDATA